MALVYINYRSFTTLNQPDGMSILLGTGYIR